MKAVKSFLFLMILFLMILFSITLALAQQKPDDDSEPSDTTELQNLHDTNNLNQQLDEQLDEIREEVNHESFRPHSQIPQSSRDQQQKNLQTQQTSEPSEDKTGCLKLDPYTGVGSDIISNFDFPDVDIVELAKTLGKLTCINFIIDKDVKGKISIISNSPLTIGDAWKAFLSALDTNGFTLLPAGKFFRITRQRDAKDKQVRTYTDQNTPNNDMIVTRIIRLQYINAEEVSRVFRSFMPPNTRIVAYEQTNTLMITDTGANINKLLDMLKLLDVESFDEKLEVIPIQYASATNIAQLIDQLLLGNGSASRTGSALPPRNFTTMGHPQIGVRRTQEGGVISHIIPDDRTNSVIVSANAEGLQRVKELIQKLDVRVTVSTGGSRIHVVYLQFADAEQIAQTLNNLATGSLKNQTPGARPGEGPPTAQLFEGSIKISADKATNSLVITGTPADFMTMQTVIDKLDVPRDQVYVEAVIMEMTLDKTFEFGTSIASPSKGVAFLPNDDFKNFILNPFTSNGVVLNFKSGHGTRTFTIPGTDSTFSVDSMQGLVRALHSNSNANVLSTPQILTLDNQQATIEVSENIPILNTTAVQGAGVQQSITREKIALTLTIKPQINKISNFVKLDIKQKIEDISNKIPPKGVADQAFATTSRSSDTTVVVQDGDTVVLGGLVRDKVEDKSVKVPLLGDIPIIGWLFSAKSSSTVKQNLVAFITPTIIKQYQDIRKVLDKKIRERDIFIDKNMGGNDPMHSYKEKLIKNLPPLEKLRKDPEIKSTETGIIGSHQ